MPSPNTSPRQSEDPTHGPLAAIYREQFGFVWRSLRRLGVGESDLPDACQDVFLVVHKKLSQYDHQAKVTTWLYGICFRIASDWRRSAYARHEVVHESPEPAPAEEREVPSSVDQGQHRALLQAALDALPLEQRAVFTLFELEGLAGHEIAAMLGVPVATVHSRLRLAREAFRRALSRAVARDEFRLRRIGVMP